MTLHVLPQETWSPSRRRFFAWAGLAGATQALLFLVQHGVAPYFFFVSLRLTRSSA